MNLALWATQAALAAVFAFSGIAKATGTKEALVASGQTGLTRYSLRFIRFIAAAELFAVAGLTLPWALGIARGLTPLAALGLAVIMVGAALSHGQLALASEARRAKELRNVATNAFILAACLFVAVGRLGML